LLDDEEGLEMHSTNQQRYMQQPYSQQMVRAMPTARPL
jgi:hypothetical protein